MDTRETVSERVSPPLLKVSLIPKEDRKVSSISFWCKKTNYRICFDRAHLYDLFNSHTTISFKTKQRNQFDRSYLQ
jgi:hypothetical protein